MNTDTAFLSLDTYVLAGTSNINAAKTIFTFRNVNIKNIIGEMWNRYDKFSIRMVSTQYSNLVSGPNAFAYLIQNNMKGFDWINCYDEKYGTGQTYMPVGFVKGSNTPVYNIPVNNQYCFNFRKGKEVIDIEMNITNIGANGGIGTPTITAMPDQNYTFIIQPAENNQNEMGYLGLYTTQTTTGTITTPTTWSSKTVTDNCRTYTYYSFDMRLPCREFWDKYDDFEILCAGYMYSGYTGLTTDQIMPLTMTGFNWNNFSKAGNIQSQAEAVVAITKGRINGSDHEGNNDVYYPPVQFTKSGDLVTFTLKFKNYDNSALNTYTAITNRIGYLPFFIRPIKKDMNSEKGTLSISSAELTTTMTDLGITNATYTNITINNVDLRQACEGFWDKYNKFNIFLTMMYPYNIVSDVSERWLNLYCEGLQLDQQMKDSNAQQTTQTWNMGTITSQSLNLSGNGPVTFGNTHSTMFYKSTDKVNLRFYVKRIDNISVAVNTTALKGLMTFTIVPVSDE